jgi:hypothetical protein
MVTEINLDHFVRRAGVISIGHYPDTLYIMWKKILQPHFARVIDP